MNELSLRTEVKAVKKLVTSDEQLTSALLKQMVKRGVTNAPTGIKLTAMKARYDGNK